MRSSASWVDTWVIQIALIVPYCDNALSFSASSRSSDLHASAREATSDRGCARDFASVSTHASDREATPTPRSASPQTGVSIHASAREATSVGLKLPVLVPVSIHASAREATDTTAAGIRQSMFLSTPPHGRRPPARSRRQPQTGFYPRLRTGGDDRGCVVGSVDLVSIHASAREATHLQATRTLLQLVSIHASAREATQAIGPADDKRRVSIHASAREATSMGHAGHLGHRFLSTPPHGRRRAHA